MVFFIGAYFLLSCIIFVALQVWINLLDPQDEDDRANEQTGAILGSLLWPLAIILLLLAGVWRVLFMLAGVISEKFKAGRK